MDWNWLIWYGIGIASGVAIGHEEIEKKLNLKGNFRKNYGLLIKLGRQQSLIKMEMKYHMNV